MCNKRSPSGPGVHGDRGDVHFEDVDANYGWEWTFPVEDRVKYSAVSDALFDSIFDVLVKAKSVTYGDA